MAKLRKDKNKDSTLFPAIISIDPFSSTAYRFEKNELTPITIGKSGKKDDFYISYISAKEAVTGTIDLGENVIEEDLQDAIEIKAYEELGLDTSVNYKFNYVSSPIKNDDQSSKNYSVFAINVDAMNGSFEKVNKKIPYIDYITTAPFLIRSLYKKNILDSYGNECFLFFQKHDAFLAIYKDGEYVYSKSLKYSLSEINEKFSSSLGERVDEDNFYNLLSSEGLKPSNIEYQQHFMKVFGEVFLYINDVAVFARRASGINQIDRVYIGTEIGTINGMNEYVKSYMGTDVKDFNFGLQHGDTNNQINQIHILMILTTQLYFESGSADESLNFTIYKRPPSLDKRPAGKFLMVVAAALALSMAYPIYQFGFGSIKFFQYTQEKNNLDVLKPEAEQLKNEVDGLQTVKDSTLKELSGESAVLNTRRALLREIHNKRVHYSMKAEVFVDLIKMVNENGVRLEKISQENKNVILSLVGNNEKKFTELMDQIANTDRYSIRTKEIVKDDEKKLYRSDITMEIL